MLVLMLISSSRCRPRQPVRPVRLQVRLRRLQAHAVDGTHGGADVAVAGLFHVVGGCRHAHAAADADGRLRCIVHCHHRV